MTRTMRHPMQILVPVASLLISGLLVGQQYYRLASLKRDLKQSEREIETLRAKLPKGHDIKLHEHNHTIDGQELEHEEHRE